MNIPKCIQLIQQSLSKDLLKKEYRELNDSNPFFGHCYVATESLYHLLGSEKDNYKPCCGRDDNNIVHWWLQHKTTNEIFDVTSEQYHSVGKFAPYEKGRGTGFLTKFPSKRTTILIERIKSKFIGVNDFTFHPNI